MPHVRLFALPRQFGRWSVLGTDGQEAGGGLAASTYAMPGFFVGWITVGVLIALVLVARGHDARTMISLGAGLGPLMAVAASDRIRRESDAAPLVLEPGVDHGGPLDVLLVAPGDPADVLSVQTTLDAVRPELGTLTIARPVAYEWVDGELDNEVVTESRRALVDAAERLDAGAAELALWPGTVAAVIERFRREHPRGLVLVATAEPVPSN